MYDGNRMQARSRKPPLAGRGNPYGVNYAAGDVVTAYLDFDKNQVSFAVNGKHQGIAFENFIEYGKIQFFSQVEKIR